MHGPCCVDQHNTHFMAWNTPDTSPVFQACIGPGSHSVLDQCVRFTNPSNNLSFLNLIGFFFFFPSFISPFLREYRIWLREVLVVCGSWALATACERAQNFNSKTRPTNFPDEGLWDSSLTSHIPFSFNHLTRIGSFPDVPTHLKV